MHDVIRPIGLPFCPRCVKDGAKDVYHRPEDCPRSKAAGTGNRREALMGNHSKLVDAIGRTTLAGGKDIIIRAIEAYRRKHEGEEELPRALEDIGNALRGRKP